MPSHPTVSIITRIRFRHCFLRRVCQSVLGQTRSDWEHIFVNDGGDPLLLELGLEAFRPAYGERLRVLHRTEDFGMQQASNAALEIARGDYVAIHDDDDSWHPRFLHHTVKTLDAHPLLVGAVTQTERILEGFNAHGELIEFGRDAYQPIETLNLLQSASRNPFPPIALLYRRSVHDEVGRFNPALTVLGDWDFHLRLLMAGDVSVIPHMLAYYHWRTTPATPGLGNSVIESIEDHRAARQRLIHHLLERGGAPLSLNLAVAMQECEERELAAAAQQADRDRLGRLEGRVEKIHQRLRRWESFFTGQWFRLRRRPSGQEGTPPPRPPAPPELNRNQEAFQEWEALLPGARALSFDLFDTVFSRLTLHYRDIFLHWEREVRQALGPRSQGFPWAQARLWAESVSRRRHPAGEPDLAGIHAVLEEWIQRWLPGEEIPQPHELIALELKVERSLIRLREAFKPFLEAARRSGKPILYLSDMYLPARTLQEWIAMLGLPAGKLFVSNEAAASKDRGTLFPVVAEKIGLPPGQILHLGDNAHSDVAMARAAGWKAVHFPLQVRNLRWDEAQPAYAYYPDDLLGSAIYGTVREGFPALGEAGVGKQFGFEVAGPLQLAFLNFLADRLQPDPSGVRRAVFLARDGYELLPRWKALGKARGLQTEGRYLLASRRLLNFPAIDLNSESGIDFLVTPNPGLSGKFLLERLGMDFAPFAEKWNRLGLPDPDTVLSTPRGVFKSEDLHRLVRRFMHTIKPALQRMQETERALLTEYLQTHGIEGTNLDEHCFVDIGWQASAVLSLQRLWGKDSCHLSPRGVYFATWDTAKEALRNGCRLESFFVHLGKPYHRAGILAPGVGLIEQCFSAPHPSIQGLRKGKDGTFEGVYAPEPGSSPAVEEIREDIRRGTDLFWKQFLKHFPMPLQGSGWAYLGPVLQRTFHAPKAAEGEVLGSLPHQDSFGGPLRGPHLAVVPAQRSKRNLQEAYHLSAWKPGFLVQLSDKERSWLREG